MTFEEYMSEYEQSHQHPLNRKIHTFAVPAISLSVLGILQSIPAPRNLDWSYLVVFLSLLFYGRFKSPKILVMVFLYIAFLYMLLSFMGLAILHICMTIFVVAWLLQFYGHYVEKKKPSFFRDIFFLLIGPLWFLRKIKLL